MKPFIVLVLVVCVGIYIIYLAWNIDDIMKKKKHIKIKFRSFKEFYVVAPEKWDLQKDFVRYRYSENFKYKNCEILLSAEKYQYFRFSWLDTIRYRRYKKYNGQTWECFQAHDNSVYPDINPNNAAWFTFWRPLHGKSSETARPFVPVKGAHDMYHTGEYAYFNGKLYKCIQDTAYSPEDYDRAWQEEE